MSVKTSTQLFKFTPRQLQPSTLNLLHCYSASISSPPLARLRIGGETSHLPSKTLRGGSTATVLRMRKAGISYTGIRYEIN